MAETLYLVDGSGFVFRAYHALPPLTTKDGTPTGAVYGFAQMVLRLEQEYRPSHLAVVFDPPGRTFRDDLSAEYKAHRPPPPEDLVPQFALVRQVTAAFGVPQLEVPGYEADDVIATLAQKARAAGLRVVIVSSDKDLMQLVCDEVVLLDTLKGETRLYGPPEVEEKFGVPPSRLGDLLALMGDSSDNVPGVPGIGPKTAAALVQRFPSLTELVARLDEVAAMKELRGAKAIAEKLRAHQGELALSRRLVTLDGEVPLPLGLDDLRRPEPEIERVEALLLGLEFKALVSRLRPTAARSAAATGGALGQRPPEVIFDGARLRERLAALAARGEIGLEVVLLASTWHAPLVGVAVAADGEAPLYLPLSHRYLGAPHQLPLGEAMVILGALFVDGAVRKLSHGQKALHLLAERHGYRVAGLAGDPELAAYLLDPAQPHELAALAAKAGELVEERESLVGSGKRAQTIDSVEIERLAPWAARRAEAALLVGRQLGAEVLAKEMGWLLQTVELPLGRVLAVIERHGVRLDVPHLHRLSQRVGEQLAGLEAEVRAMAGYEVNLGSPKQLQELLFERLALPPVKKTKTGLSTDAEVLEELAPLHPVAAKIHEHRGLAKLKSTYLDALPALVDPRSGRLHTSYNQTVAATGRLSSSEPNLQNIPIRGELGPEIRRAFIADQGNLLVAADYSQIELRILAHLSGDEVLGDAFARGQDVHTRTAVEMFEVRPEAVSPEMRRIAKAINFGIIYGQTDFGLARTVGIPREQAKRYIESYFQRYAGVARYMQAEIARAKKELGSRTLLGRFRPLPDLHAKAFNQRAYAERMARNTPIQGTAADLLKLAMIRVQERLEAEAPSTRMLLTVHDELVLETPAAEAERVGALVREAMEQIYPLKVPLQVDVGWGPSWAEC